MGDVFFDDKNIANTLHAILKPIARMRTDGFAKGHKQRECERERDSCLLVLIQ